MKNLIKSIIEEEAYLLGISSSMLLKLADRGSQMAFRHKLVELLEKIWIDEKPKRKLREIILSCAYGGAIAKSVEKES